MLRSLTVRHYRAAAAAADNPHQMASDSRSDFLICAGIRKIVQMVKFILTD
jgi:hypothetical protein